MIQFVQSAVSHHLRLGSAGRQIVTFALVGGMATLTHFTVALLLNSQLGVSPLHANFGGYVSSVLISYVGNALLTFGAQLANARQILRFGVVSLSGLALGQALTYLGVNVLGAPYAITLLVVVSLVPVLTFVASRLWTFNIGKAADEPVPSPGHATDSSGPGIVSGRSGDRRAKAIVALIFLAAILPVVAAPVLPMIDYYSHVARYFVLAHIDTDTFLQQSYELRWAILPNIGLDVIGTALMTVLPATLVAKLLVLMIFAVQYFGLLAFNRQVSGSISPVTALLAAPLLYSFILGWGFANFLLGLGLVFWGGAWWLAKRHRPLLAIPVASAIAVLIFLTHGVAFALYGLLLGGLELGLFFAAKPRSLRALVISMAGLAVQAAAPAILFLASPTSKSPDGLSNADESIRKLAHAGTLTHRLGELAIHRLATIFRVSESPSLFLDMASFAGIAVILGALMLRGRVRLPLLVLPALAIAVVLVAAMPPALFGVGYIADRMPLFMAFLIVGSLIPKLQNEAFDQICVSLLVAIVGAKIMWTGVGWQTYRQDRADFEAVASHIPAHSLVGYANTANLTRLEDEPRCQMYGPLLIPLRAAAAPIFAYSSQQPIALRGRLNDASLALVSPEPLKARRAPSADWSRWYGSGSSTTPWCVGQAGPTRRPANRADCRTGPVRPDPAPLTGLFGTMSIRPSPPLVKRPPAGARPGTWVLAAAARAVFAAARRSPGGLCRALRPRCGRRHLRTIRRRRPGCRRRQDHGPR